MLTATQLVGGANPLDGNRPYDLEGNCGYFARSIEWTVVQAPQQRRGIIFQLIKRAIEVDRWDATNAAWVGLPAGAIDAYVGPNHAPKLSTDSLYWEAWQITPGNTHPTYAAGRRGRADDTFGLTAIIPAANHANSEFRDTTRGRFTIVGAAFFMETDLSLQNDFGFRVHQDRPAGAIPSHIALGRRMLDDMEATSHFIKHRVVVSWDSSVLGADASYGETDVVTDTVQMVNRNTVGRSLSPLLTV